ncbi:Serine/threonine-protein kinase 4 [Entophlyctis luteolus]|nr:Serine/threonine-protein kinase 4 [Entophlyctis luteolus]
MQPLSAAELADDPLRVFELLDKIGTGSYGFVHRALHRRSREIVAIKIVPASSTDLDQSVKEINFMTGIKSEFIIAYYGSYVRDTELWIVMEYCAAGSVSDIMESCDLTLSEDQISVVCRYVLQGLSYMHAFRKIHRDIKAGNILVNAKCEAKLADFGVSGQLSDSAAKRKTTTFQDVIQEVGHGTAADIWSLGITCIEMADGRPPLADIHPMRAIFQIPTKPPPRLQDEERYSKVFREFVAKCLVKDQKARPSADELLNDPFIRRNPSISNLASMVNTTLQNSEANSNGIPFDELYGDDISDGKHNNYDDKTVIDVASRSPFPVFETKTSNNNPDPQLNQPYGGQFEEVFEEDEYDEDQFSNFDDDQSDKYPSRPETPDQSKSQTPLPGGQSPLYRAPNQFSQKSPTPPPMSVSKTFTRSDSPPPGSMHTPRGMAPRKKSTTEDRLLAALEDRRDTDIAAVVAKFKRRRAVVIDVILEKGGSM